MALSLRRLFGSGDPDQVFSSVPLVDYIDPEDCPFYSLLPPQALSAIDTLLVSRAWSSFDDGDFVLGANFHLDVLPPLQVPGLSQMSLGFDPDPATGELRIGERARLTLTNVGLTLTFDPHLLNEPGTTKGAKLRIKGDVELSSDGLRFLRFASADLLPSEVAGTDLLLEVKGLTIGKGDTLFTLDDAKITLPRSWGTDDADNLIAVIGDHVSWDKYGLSGTFELASDAGISTTLLGLKVRLDKAAIKLSDGALDDARLSGEVDISSFAKNSDASTLNADFHIGTGGVSASLRSDDDQPVATIDVKDLLKLEVAAIRLDAPRDQGGGAPPPVLWLSGSLTPTIMGDWPAFAFDEIGLDAKGGIHLAAGASVATTSPFSVDWSFVQLTVTAFSLSRPRDAPNDIELRVTAAVQLVDGIPAGVSVDGLVARWDADKNTVDLRFDGIGVAFGVPGAFHVDAAFAFKAGGFKGHGALTVDALDLSLDVLVDAHRSDDDRYNTMFLTAESKLFPGGIPIGATATSLYGVSGLLAINRELGVAPDNSVPPRPDSQRYFTLFDENDPGHGRPRGFAAPAKWRDAYGKTSIGFGVLIGTSDEGFAFSARGALLLSLPDLSLLLTATADILSPRKGLLDGGTGDISALLAILPDDDLMRLDLRAAWAAKPLYDMAGAGGGTFYFNDPTRFELWAGKPPETGAMMSTRLFDINDKWWLSAGGWFYLDASRLATVGAYAPLSLRFGADDFYAEIAGTARAELTASWSPIEAFGTLDVDGNACIAAAGLKLSFGVQAHVGVEIATPTDVRLRLRVCHDFGVGGFTVEICLGFTFGFSDRTLPTLNSVPIDIAFAPRQWTPIADLAGQKDDGVVPRRNLLPGDAVDIGIVQPHSAISLSFPGAMTIGAAVRPLINAPMIMDPLPEPISGGSGVVADPHLRHAAPGRSG